ncbi:nitrite reductase large subunit NirB [Corynebacterium guangdongense]|uniref:assimilatory sulfite reductase (ferredoxin) n=1 Tax=Corynebacterium guangdongense TaxID=1783348 RepID=A0ABU1ZUQ5_9CORY|nr:nitrite reductase large subunit NirB [Corynebacterium guangdongense]MDR7328520.1 nitrite reductase (NADH) large subunit [Corynebacterium guangdongense]WJZ17097.1 Nitrite reductase [NAD(P)H] [Corynebacterium guangdongense]
MTDQAIHAGTLVIGFGMVGHRFAQEYSQLRPDTPITVINRETGDYAYDRVQLSSYVGTWNRADLHLDRLPANVTVVPGRAVSVKPETREVVLEDGRVFSYDELVMATGSRPFIPRLPGNKLPQVHVYRTLDDMDGIRSAIEGVVARHGDVTATVIGGGLLGLEAANAVQHMGAKTHVVEMAPRLMPLQVDDAGGEVLSAAIRELGVEVHVGAASREIRESDDRVGGVVLDLGEQGEIETDLVIFSAGIRPRDSLGPDTGLELGPRGGFAVDRQCRTSIDGISAIGECAAVDGATYGLVAPGNTMAEIVARRLAGEPGPDFEDPDLSTKLKLMGVDVASFGDAFSQEEGRKELHIQDPISGVYKKLILDAEGKRLLGGILVGEAGNYSMLRPMVGSELPGDPVSLIAPESGAGASAIGVDALPDQAQICSCNNVSKGDVRAAIGQGCHSVETLMGATRAGTSCGSCIPLLKSILEGEGIEQSTAVCAHFSQSRAELFEIAQATGINDFPAFIGRFGRGGGCEVCKPTLASIFASLHTEDHVLEGERAGLQDTNDRMLGNMQKNGTYSVIPRMPAGNVTGEQLIEIGRIAEDYDLYTKVTGAQRLALFGARVEDLPDIWRRLIDVGMESGQAYGKSLRAVKSCVGTDWCRYGQQDSVAMAVRLETRYRGLRSPHKFKMGVSGCARECAEARGKDVGVIATENGWNLYVGGNGGATPRHAELLVGDLDDETLIRYIDRYLGFYIRTADRLQRTAAWQESVDGGLDHIRDVVVEDSLGIGRDLEEFMARHVTHYSDEWKATLEDPEKVSRFVSFINAPDTPDPTVQFEKHPQGGRRVPLMMPTVNAAK